MSWNTRNLRSDDINSDGTIQSAMPNIITKPSTRAYREGWDRIFGKKKHETTTRRIKVSVEETKNERNSEGDAPQVR